MNEIPQAPGYFATTDGRIWSSKSNKYLKLIVMKSGYLKFSAYYGARGTMKNFYVHIAVCLAFYGSPVNGQQEVRHLDGDLLNNRSVNLRWGTSKENHADKILHGTDPKGERNGFARFSDNDITDMRRLHSNGQSCASIAKMYGTHRANVSRIVTRKVWSHL